MTEIKVSIIIPVKEINDYIRESVPIILKMDYQNYEIIILPNEDNIPFSAEKTKIVSSGKVWPAQKRNIWADIAKGEILAFLDDDAYPRSDWLTTALKYFEDKNIVGVGGPWITPLNDPFWARVSGAVFLSKIWWWNPERYISVWEEKYVDDWPSVNLFIRKQDFLAIWWFDNDFWPGEDTKLCLDLIKKTWKNILYSPEVVVWHHRRSGFIKHLNQVWNYGLHRWHFFRNWDENSRKLIYLVPTLFLLFLIFWLAISILFWWIIVDVYLIWLYIYFLALVLAILDIYLRIKNFSVAFCSSFYIFFTHIVYGYKFLQWLLKENLISKLR